MRSDVTFNSEELRGTAQFVVYEHQIEESRSSGKA